jgi:predicted nucleotidyltransferase
MILPTMGMKESKAAVPPAKPPPQRLSLADALFSGTQQRVLALLFGQPGRSFYASELIALTRSGSGAVQRELARLAQSELVTVRVSGKQKHYQANPQSPIYAELCGITEKTMGLAEPLRSALAPLAPRLRAAFVYGSVAKRQDTASSDVDLMLVSEDLSYPELFLTVEELSERLGRKVNPTIYTPTEFAQRVRRGDSFVKRVLAQPRIWLIGSDDALAP